MAAAEGRAGQLRRLATGRQGAEQGLKRAVERAGLLKGLQTTFLCVCGCVCSQNKYKSVETKTFCNNIKIANETEQQKKQSCRGSKKRGEQQSRVVSVVGGRQALATRPLTGAGAGAGVYWQQCCYLCKRLVKVYIAAVLFL